MSSASDVCPYKADPMTFIWPLRPEQKLLARMLELACNEYNCNEAAIRREAQRWVESNGDLEWGFIWACGELDLDARKLRALLRANAWPREGFANAGDWGLPRTRA